MNAEEAVRRADKYLSIANRALGKGRFSTGTSSDGLRCRRWEIEIPRRLNRHGGFRVIVEYAAGEDTRGLRQRMQVSATKFKGSPALELLMELTSWPAQGRNEEFIEFPDARGTTRRIGWRFTGLQLAELMNLLSRAEKSS